MIVIISKYLIPQGFCGFAIFPFVFLKSKMDSKDEVLLNHEKIHLHQQLELLILPFFILYGIEFLIKLVKHKNVKTAYKNISFERETYANEKDLNYLKKRSFWRFLKYV